MKEISNLQNALAENVRASRSDSTRRLYDRVWNNYAARFGADLPASPVNVALYLTDIGQKSCPSTVAAHAAAIAARHRDAGLESPSDNEGVKRMLSGHARRNLHVPKQASPIDTHAYERIQVTAQDPRPTRGGRMESLAEAMRRGTFDIAMIGLMRDALLRRGECSALVWGDLSVEPDGTGRLLIRRSKTDQVGRGCIRYVNDALIELLHAIYNASSASLDDPIVPLSPSQICRRIQSACRQAGLRGNFSGHSPRIGMAVDLARAGVSLPALMEAGRWKSPSMPAHYVRAVEAGSGAVAGWYAS